MKARRMFGFLLTSSLQVSLGSVNCDFGSDRCWQVDSLPDSTTIAALGDSIMDAHWKTCQYVPGHLSLMVGDRVQDYSNSAARLTDPSADDIYDQYERAGLEMAELGTVILEGGGNDIRRECADTEQPACAEDVETVLREVGNLVDQMVGDGREKIVYVGYYGIAGFVAPFMGALNTLMDQVGPLCSAKGCAFVDLRPVFAGHPNWISVDGVHPTLEGCAVIAGQIHDAMMTNCVCED